MSIGAVVVRADSFNVAPPGVNTNILTTSITPQMSGFFQICIALTTSSVVNMTETRDATTFTHGLNKSAALPIGDIYSFTIPVSASSSYNFQVETDSVIRVLRVLESTMPVAVNSQGFQA